MKNSSKRQGNSTQAIHVGEDKFRVSGPVGVSIARTSGFTFATVDEMRRWAEGKSSVYIYTRYGNPTLAVAEAKLAALERGEASVVTSSGSSAISSALLSQLQAGDEVISSAQIYGGSYRLLRDIFPRFGIRVRFIGPDLAGIERMVTPRTKVLYIETPTNPSLRLVDLKKAADFAREWGLVSIIDNTFATPVLQKPLEMGFNLVAHSASKYLAGHSDIIAGAVIGSTELIKQVRKYVIYLGGSMDPGAAFLLIRGLKTLEVRVEKQCKTAMAVAKFLERHPKVARVRYPGLVSHPDHKLAKRQMGAFGAMMSFDIKNGLRGARSFGDGIRVFLLATSLGGVESLVSLPIYTSHFGMSTEELRAAGVEPGTVRLSIGLEDADDLIEDLRQALR
ncbi:MAG TPA: aminotransferase class I/II-fold pyridoxal phosphate-dependent enzyme [Candidatus Acidoferrales bacterium]|nr:aminotransferase class I/II-fold pyridoxal phosphate-dependent enzyme [Candidatus Acidoferrales bacterium]